MASSAAGDTDGVEQSSPEPSSPEPKLPAGWPHDEALPVRGWGPAVDLPLDELWATFIDVSTWSRWNPCISWARIGDDELRPGTRLTWAFGPIKRSYLYRMPAMAMITEVVPGRRVTWEVSLPGFHALHSYLFEGVGNERSRIGSWEIASGPLYRILRPFWLAHFRFVRDASIAGSVELVDRRVRIVELGPEPTSSTPAVVVVPGIDGRAAGAEPLADRLALNRRVLIVDYAREIESSLDDLADTIAAALPERCDLIGQSFGTWLAAEIARRRPVAVRRVAMVAPFTRVGPVRTRLRAISGRLLPSTSATSGRGDVARRIRWQLGRDAPALFAGVDQPALALLFDDGAPLRRRGEASRLASIFSRPDDRVVIVDEAGDATTAMNDVVASGIENFLS